MAAIGAWQDKGRRCALAFAVGGMADLRGVVWWVCDVRESGAMWGLAGKRGGLRAWRDVRPPVCRHGAPWCPPSPPLLSALAGSRGGIDARLWRRGM